MKLNIMIDGQSSDFEVPDELLTEAEDLFKSMDADMDKGWQMSREWVASPDAEQRCQIVADKILTAIEHNNEKLLMMMVAYILRTMPGVRGVNIDITGDMNETEIIMADDSDQSSGKPLGPIFN